MAVTNEELQRAENNTLWQCFNANGTLYYVQKTNGQYLTWGNFGTSQISIDDKSVISLNGAVTNINKSAKTDVIVPETPPGSNGQSNNGTASDDNTGESAFSGDSSAENSENSENFPGRRPYNPLGFLASYTYQLSLYVISPEAYKNFIATGRRTIGKGAYLVAQSGGINSVNEKRADGFKFDYYIDDLTIKAAFAQETGTAANAIEMSFTVTEPYGFSFISNLRRASNQIIAESGDSSGPENATRQFFILGIHFLGYDSLGNSITGDTIYKGKELDPNARGKTELYQLYYDININQIQFKIDGRSVVYNVSAVCPSIKANTTTRGFVDKTTTLKGSTVEGALNHLVDQLNKQQEEVYKDVKDGPLTQYAIEFIGPDSSLISKAQIVTKDDLDKLKLPGSNAKNTSEVNDAAVVRTNPNTNERTIQLTNNIPILQAIDQVIRMSDLAKNGLKVLYDNAVQPDASKQNSTSQTEPPSKTIYWYNCSSKISDVVWHEESNDWRFTITYMLQTYQTPVIDSSLAVPGKNYYGPYKKYSYWYTGKNTEIIQYEQTLDNAYITVALGPTPDEIEGNSQDNAPETGKTLADNPAGAPKHKGKPTEQSKQGYKGPTAEAVNNYVTSIFDPSAQLQADITIFGDPDFLVQDSSYTEASLYNRFYGTDGFTVNPNGGQVFVEIDFKEAVDYTYDKVDIKAGSGVGGITGEPGTLSLNDSIKFFNNSNVGKDNSLTYRLITIDSMFRGGSFQQKISGAMVPIDENENGENQREDDTKNTPQTGTNPSNAKTQTGNSGIKTDPKQNPKQVQTQEAKPSRTGADDDNTGTLPASVVV